MSTSIVIVKTICEPLLVEYSGELAIRVGKNCTGTPYRKSDRGF